MMKQSFYDWCIETSNEYLLELWDYELNKLSPKDIGSHSHYKMYFKCQRGIHESELFKIESIVINGAHVVRCHKCNSFGQWCIDSDRQDLLNRWDYDLNKKDPFDVSGWDNGKYYFKCPNLNPLHPSELKSICNLRNKPGSSRCTGCDSFAQWGIDNICDDFLEKYWSKKNSVNPFTILSGSSCKVWIKCQNKDYHEDYEIIVSDFKRGYRCPYCSGNKVNYYDSLGYKMPISIKMWSDKNEKSPYDYMWHSGKKVWFHCDIHGDYMQTIVSFCNSNGVCPKCSMGSRKSKLQIKVEKYLKEDLLYICNHENECSIVPLNVKTNHYLFYDIEVIDLKLIIEVNGEQHYRINGFNIKSAQKNNITPNEQLEYQKWKDNYKKEYALSHGYYFLEIPYWTDDKQQSYKTLIDEKISEIINNSISTVTTTGDDGQLLS